VVCGGGWGVAGGGGWGAGVHEALHALAAPKTPIVLCVCETVCTILQAISTSQTNAKEENDEETRRRVEPQGR